MKYKLTNETIQIGDKILYRIEAVKDFADVKAGDKGGFIEKETNLSQEGDCWVYHNAQVYDNARIFGDARICEKAQAHGCAQIFGYAQIYGDAEVFGYALICGEAEVFGHAKVLDIAKVSGRAEIGHNAEVKTCHDFATIEDFELFVNGYATWTKSNNIWRADDFRGSGEELIEYVSSYSDTEGAARLVELIKSVEVKDRTKKGPSEKQWTPRIASVVFMASALCIAVGLVRTLNRMKIEAANTTQMFEAFEAYEVYKYNQVSIVGWTIVIVFVIIGLILMVKSLNNK